MPALPPAPFLVGVARSGTTLLRLMLDAHPELAIPPETHFLPAVVRAFRAGGRRPRERALAAITGHRRWPDFGLDAAELRLRLEDGAAASAGEVLRAFYGLYAERHGKPRWGDKSTSYVRRMRMIRDALPEARFIHLIRDGRDVALSQLTVHFGPATVEEAARKWRDEVTKARRRGGEMGGYVELRFEDLVDDPEPPLRRACELVELEFDAAMLDYRGRAAERIGEIHRDLERRGGGRVSAAERAAHQANVAQPLQPERAGGWREQMSADQQRRFARIAGGLLAELGYES